jgi:hypothetical protein
MGAPLTWLVGTTIRVKKQQQEASWLAAWLPGWWLDHCQQRKGHHLVVAASQKKHYALFYNPQP